MADPNLTDMAWVRWEIQGRQVRVETAEEVIAKTMYHRGDRATARDLFDLAMVDEREPDALAAAALLLMRHRAGSWGRQGNLGQDAGRLSRRSPRPGIGRAWRTALPWPPPTCLQ